MNEKELCFSILRTDSFLMINKNLINGIGLPPAVFLSLLIDKDYFHTNNQSLTEDGFFYETINNSERELSLSRHEQDTCVRTLLEKNLIITALKGLPARRHFKILYENVTAILTQVCKETANREIPDTSEKTDGSVCRKSTNLFVRHPQQYKTNIIKQTNVITVPQQASLVEVLAEPSTSIVLHPRKKIRLRTTPFPAEEEPEPRKPFIPKRTKMPCPIPKPQALRIIEYWKSKGFKRDIPDRKTSAYSEIIIYLHGILDGTLFSYFKNKEADRKYSAQEVEESINNFALAVFNMDYFPIDKSFVTKVTLSRFLYNKQTAFEDKKSLFLNYLKKPRKVISIHQASEIKDEMPYITAILENWFRGTFQNVDGNFKKSDLVLTSILMKKFYEENKNRLSIEDHFDSFRYKEPIPFLVDQLTRMFDREFRNNDSLVKIFTTEWLKSERTMTERFPEFLRSQRMLR
jgi:hypothetical protein